MHARSPKGAPGSRLYFASKISDAKFRRVLRHFALDCSATQTARATGISVNSVVGIFQKLRVYFTEAGLFEDPYRGGDPREAPIENPVYEKELLEFHFGRIRHKRGLKSPWGKPDYHLAESNWRFQYQMLIDARPGVDIHPMIVAHMLEIIDICGPVGRRPSNRKAGLMAVLRQTDQIMLWLERNAPEFARPEHRAELNAIRSIQPREQVQLPHPQQSDRPTKGC